MIKKTLIISYVILLFAFALPFFLRLQKTGERIQEEETKEEKQKTIRVMHKGQEKEMDMHSYLIGVTAAEMPASFPEEALKAQVVAARSYAAYCEYVKRHQTAQICTDQACCQAWKDEESMQALWGDEYEKYYNRIEQAVKATAGERLLYQGEPVFAAFHASSPGYTEDSGQVWNSVPYLISVTSPETEETLPQLVSRKCVSALDFRDAILSAAPDAKLNENCTSWVEALTRRDNGRVEKLVVGGTALSGAAVRNLFSLRSTVFDLSLEGDRFVFTVQGYGHGVGMSQQGARLMAEKGSTYKEILQHYYPGTELIT